MKYHFYFFFYFFFFVSTTVIADVSLRDKIGQMLLVGFDGKKVNAQSNIVQTIEKNNIGGVILFDYDHHKKIYNKNIANPAQLHALNRNLQYFNAQSNLRHYRPRLPLLIGVDYEGGMVNRLNERYGFPPILSAAEVGQRNPQEAESNAELMSRTLKNVGFNLNFAPVLDVNVNRDNPVIGKKNRSFSSNPMMVAAYARVYTHHFLNQKIQCVYKHFPGHGSSNDDSHMGFVDVTTTWKRDELKPYEYLLRLNKVCGAVMTAHIINRQLDPSGLPATLSYKILTDLLRHQLHFKGLIITDDMQMRAIHDHYGLEKALVLAINAGVDMLIFGNNLLNKPQDPEKLIDIIEVNVLAGNIPLRRINESYQRVVSFKQSII